MNKVEFLSSNSERLAAFADMSGSVGARADYVQGGGGNTSVKLEGGLMAIKASGYRLSDVAPDAGYAVMDCAALAEFYNAHSANDFSDTEKEGSAAAKANTLQIDGLAPLRPSVEAGFHSLLDTFVIHSHSVYSNLAACCAQSADILKAAFADAPYSAAIVPYTDPGARLTFIIKDKLKAKPAVLLMENHGLIVHAPTAQECLRLHEDANRRLAEQFSLAGCEFPGTALEKTAEGLFASRTPYLRTALRSGSFSPALLMDEPLYPDQLVFFNGTLFFEGAPAPGCCVLSFEDGTVLYNMDEKKAEVIEQTLTAVTYIISKIREHGLTLRTMNASAKDFIAGWESEKYRKSISGTTPAK